MTRSKPKTPRSAKKAAKSKKKSFYTVTNGRKIGIFKTWDDTSKQVYQHSGGTQQGFVTLDEAIQHMSNFFSEFPLYEEGGENIVQIYRKDEHGHITSQCKGTMTRPPSDGNSGNSHQPSDGNQTDSQTINSDDNQTEVLKLAQIETTEVVDDKRVDIDNECNKTPTKTTPAVASGCNVDETSTKYHMITKEMDPESDDEKNVENNKDTQRKIYTETAQKSNTTRVVGKSAGVGNMVDFNSSETDTANHDVAEKLQYLTTMFNEMEVNIIQAIDGQQQQELVAKNIENENDKKHIRFLTNKNQELANSVGELIKTQKDLEKAQKEIISLQQAVIDANEKTVGSTNALQKIIDTQEDKIRNLKGELNAAQDEINQNASVIKTLGCEKIEMETRYEKESFEMQMTVRHLQDELNDAKREIDTRCAEIKSIQKELQDELRGANTIIREKDSQIRNLQEDMLKSNEKMIAMQHSASTAIWANAPKTVREPANVEPEIIKFSGPKSLFSNMYRCQINYNGKKFSSVEQAYNEAKCEQNGYKNLAKAVIKVDDPFIVHEMTKDIIETEEWKENKEKILEEIMRRKCIDCPRFANALVEIKNKNQMLVENTLDEYWGIGASGKGENKCGKILMKISNSLPDENEKGDSKVHVPTKPQGENKTPKVLIIGNSHINNLDPQKLTTLDIRKERAPTIIEATKIVENMEQTPENVIIHLVTNDVKISPVAECVSNMKTLVDKVKNINPNGKTIVSLPPPRKDDVKLGMKMLAVNNTLKAELDNVHFSEHRILSGPASKHLWRNDGVHFTDQGTAVLAADFKYSVIK